MADECLVEMRDISKFFGGVVALDGVSFSVKRGEAHVLLGENGAGKSTLMKILSGVYTPTSGQLLIKGEEYNQLGPKEAKNIGVSIIHQELSLVNEISVAENIFIGRLPTKKGGIVDKKKLKRETQEVLDKVGLEISPDEPVENLKISQKQLVEIAKALSLNAEVLIMDEPTSSLTYEEIQNLFDIIRELKKQGVGIVFISHKLEEAMEIGDRVTVLKDGSYMGTKQIKDVTTDKLISMMVGEELDSEFVTAGEIDQEEIKEREEERDISEQVKLEVKNLTRKDRRVKDISFKLYEREILGFFGLIGSGRTEMARALIGADSKETGQVFLNGEEVDLKNPYDALKKGVGLIPENRLEEGFCSNFPIWKNASLPNILKASKLQGTWGLTNKSYEVDIAENVRSSLDLKCDSLEQKVNELSGGNQQKVVVGKWLEAGIDTYIFDEPTKGIDVGVKQNIYNIIKRLAEEGNSIMFISSELPELLSVCDRILVFNEGNIAADFEIEEATKEKIMQAATIGKKRKGS